MPMTIRARPFAAAALLLCTLAGCGAALAQEPCCAVAAIDLTTATVTARERRGGRTLHFKVVNPAVLRTLKVGQAVFADESFGKVAFVPGGYACCELLEVETGQSGWSR